MENLVFFDANCMVGKWGTYSDRFPCGRQALIKEMDKYNIGEALVYAAQSREYHPIAGNEALMKEIEGESRFHPCWGALPPYADEMPAAEEFLRLMMEKKVRAIRLFPDGTVHRFSLAEWSCGELFDKLEEFRVPLFLDFTNLSFEGDDFPADSIYSICEAHPGLPVILLQPGYRTCRLLFPLFDKFDNLRVEISRFLVHRGIEYICRNFGAERLIFGTKLPYQSPGPAVTMVTYANISEEDKRKIAGDNLRSLLRAVGW